MAKRGAAAQLTDRNWQDEEETEEAGHFKQANENEINKRVIKKAKRRVTGSDTPSVFKGFQGFGTPSLPGSTSSPLTTSTTFKGFGPFGSSPNSTSSPVTAAPKVATKEDSNNTESQYMKQLKTLNDSVSEWIKKHIAQDPYVDLSPVFRDYEKHLANIEKKFTQNNSVTTTQQNMKPKDLDGASTSTDHTSLTELSRPVVSAAVTSTTGLNNRTNPNQSSERTSSEAAGEPDDSAKPDSHVRSVPEEGAFYSSRCKLFYKRADASWAELGVGMLSLKKTENKTQAVMRNDTAVGKVILNVLLSEDTPVTRSGKNNVLLISVPNPPIFSKESDGDNSKPLTYLIRVKTGEDADSLHKEMKNNIST